MCAILTTINVLCYLIYTCNAIILHFYSLYWNILLVLIYLGGLFYRKLGHGTWFKAISTIHSVIVNINTDINQFTVIE